jgi:hypothetical protein
MNDLSPVRVVFVPSDDEDDEYYEAQYKSDGRWILIGERHVFKDAVDLAIEWRNAQRKAIDAREVVVWEID